nr:LysR substrate-binding domain-containing protein [Vineibacter terrae]
MADAALAEVPRPASRHRPAACHVAGGGRRRRRRIRRRRAHRRWPAAGHDSIALAPIDVFPVCAPKLRRKLRHPLDLRGHVLIHSATRPHDWPRWLREAGVEGQIDGSHGPRFESLGLAYQAAIEGVGVAMGVGCLVADDLAAGRLARPMSFIYRSRWTFNLIYPSARAADPRLAALCAFLRAESEVGSRP